MYYYYLLNYFIFVFKFSFFLQDDSYGIPNAPLLSTPASPSTTVTTATTTTTSYQPSSSTPSPQEPILRIYISAEKHFLTHFHL
jgi:hypothetical protein